MKKTLLLCFIHGFKGGEETFGPRYAFTDDLRTRLAVLLPRLDVRVLVYPRYETRGDLAAAVARFRGWLQDRVIDIEVAKGTPSPTVAPSVRVVLCGHSMGGIVAAEAVIQLTSDRVIIPPAAAAPDGTPDGGGGGGDDGNHTAAPAEGDRVPLHHLMFPYVQAVLSFDTPYLGISPGVVAHGAETHISTASAALTQLSELAALWSPGTPHKSSSSSSSNKNENRGSSTASAAAQSERPPASSSAGASAWGSWGRMALLAGAGAALAGGAAYLQRDALTEGWAWVASHLEFVGCLARGEELRRRVAHMARVRRELGVGFGNLYTRLGAGAVARRRRQQQQGAGPGGAGMVGAVLGSQRTFCNLPSMRGVPDQSGVWEEAVNEKAGDETAAHMAMFEPKDNPGYEKLTHDAAQLIAKWTMNDWYESSTDATTSTPN